VVAKVAAAVQACQGGPNVLVAIDGASGAGKSTFADELAEALIDRDRAVVRSTIDSFHRPRHERYQRGKDSAEGYYHDSHDLARVRDHLLEPLRAGSGTFVTAVFDEPSDTPIEQASQPVPVGAVLVMDGLFLLRPELVDYWDLSVFLVADRRREVAWQRYLHADLSSDGSKRAAEIAERTARARRHRYVGGQAMYEQEVAPRARAGFVIDNDDLAVPRVIGEHRD
jgi:uridine kinase